MGDRTIVEWFMGMLIFGVVVIILYLGKIAECLETIAILM